LFSGVKSLIISIVSKTKRDKIRVKRDKIRVKRDKIRVKRDKIRVKRGILLYFYPVS